MRSARYSLALMLSVLLLAGTAVAAHVVTQKGDLRVKITGSMAPSKLPRTGVAPIAVSVGGAITTLDQTLPPQLREMTIEINRHGQLDYQGLPVCELHQIQPATNPRALAACRQSLVGSGSFTGFIVLKGQEPYPTKGRLLVFNGREHGHQVLFGHIYISYPFATSFVITFDIGHHSHGTFGTTLTAKLSRVLGSRRYLTGIEMNLNRRYTYRGKRHSYLSSGCPAPKGFTKLPFPMLRASFEFADGRTLGSTLSGTCEVKR